VRRNISAAANKEADSIQLQRYKKIPQENAFRFVHKTKLEAYYFPRLGGKPMGRKSKLACPKKGSEDEGRQNCLDPDSDVPDRGTG